MGVSRSRAQGDLFPTCSYCEFYLSPNHIQNDLVTRVLSAQYVFKFN